MAGNFQVVFVVYKANLKALYVKRAAHLCINIFRGLLQAVHSRRYNEQPTRRPTKKYAIKSDNKRLIIWISF